jgi:hypothetical protein
MRSGLIFSVSERITNRYMLCRMLSASARKMHRDGVSTSQSINRSLQVLQEAPAAGDPPPDPPAVAEAPAEALAPTEDAALAR